MTCRVHRSARARQRAFACLALAALAASGCGGGESRQASELTLEELEPGGAAPQVDTAALSRGQPLLTTFEPYRLPNGAIRVRGRLGFPDGTRVQLSLLRRPDLALQARTQVRIDAGGFESNDLFGGTGPLPRSDYRIELLAHFNDVWQSADVMRATGDGKRLRGPGITRGAGDQAAFLMHQDVTL
jgi:hypothetical protein